MNKKYWVAIILSGILLFHFLNNFIWLKKDNFIKGADFAWHLIEAVKYHFAFKDILHSQASFFIKTGQLIQTFRLWQPTPNWPPLVYFLSALISPQKIDLFSLRLYVNFIFYTLLVLSTYFVGKKCFNRRAGLIAAFLISFYPAVSASSRQFGLDFPLLGMTAACVCLLVYSENFSKRGYSVLFGLCLGMGTLVKLQIMFFLLTPMLFVVAGICSPTNNKKLNGFLNFTFSSAIAFSIFYFYWGQSIDAMLNCFYHHAFVFYPFYAAKTLAVAGAPGSIFSFWGITYYLQGLLAHVYLLSFVLFTCALAVLLMSKNKWRFFYLLNFLVPYFILSFISVKWTRYSLPLLIFAAVVSGWLIDGMRSKYKKIPILCVLVFYSACLHLTLSWTSYRWHYSAPFRFLGFTLPAIRFPFLRPPIAFNGTEELKREGVIPHIEQELRNGKAIEIEFSDDGVQDTMALLYLYFQDAFFNKRIAMYDGRGSHIPAIDYILINDRGHLSEKEFLKDYRVLSRIRGCIFLIKK